ncbi:hypothetical protein EWM64_g5049 [Hericium alpestre]|uniref:Cytochrome c oxidase assembly protein COX20, mitochondrial n=1 Tax=Hericium alpestre TaxID=135208 RepID=A0A4Y9ZWK9_9AGAM|nr:hypothetical protein EWM64_g5049 [Hericium alpestre]
MSSSAIPGIPNDDTSAEEKAPRRPIYQTETTGNKWSDLREAAKRLSTDDLHRIGEIPCARNALLTGIASGVGVGVLRGLRATPFVASNWAMATFMAVSLGSWTVCQWNIEAERRKIQRVVEELPKLKLKKKSEDDSQSGDSPK